MHRVCSGLGGRHLPPVRRFAAGLLAGLTSTTMTYPLDLAKARLAVTRSYTYEFFDDISNKSVVFWLAPLNLIRRFRPYIFATGDILG